MYNRNVDSSTVIGLIAINTALFLVMLIPSLDNLYIWMGLVPQLAGQHPWTVFTAMFLHAGWSHIITNMITLYFFGIFLISLVGTNWFLIIYFGAGIIGNLLMLALFPIFPFGIAVGASGAIMGVGGALAILRPKEQVLVFPLPIPIPLWIAVIGGFVLVSFLPNVAWQAHLGGILFGLAVGFFLKRQYRFY